jgi:hypothetical protein
MTEQQNRCSCGKTFNSPSELREHQRNCKDSPQKEQR